MTTSRLAWEEERISREAATGAAAKKIIKVNEGNVRPVLYVFKGVHRAQERSIIRKEGQRGHLGYGTYIFPTQMDAFVQCMPDCLSPSIRQHELGHPVFWQDKNSHHLEALFAPMSHTFTFSFLQDVSDLACEDGFVFC